jgi:hypothetical protein
MLTPPLRPRCRCLRNVPNGKTLLRHRDSAAANNVADGRPPMCRPRESSLTEKGLSLAYTARTTDMGNDDQTAGLRCGGRLILNNQEMKKWRSN